MDKEEILRELKAVRAKVDHLIRETEGLKSPSSEKVEARESSAPQTKDLFSKLQGRKEVDLTETSKRRGGLLEAMDMDESLRNVYLAILRAVSATMDELKSSPEFKEEMGLEIVVKTLVKLGHVIKEDKQGQTIYRAKVEEKARKKVSNDLWDKLK